MRNRHQFITFFWIDRMLVKESQLKHGNQSMMGIEGDGWTRDIDYKYIIGEGIR